MMEIKTKEKCVDVKKKVPGKTLALEAAMLSSRKMREAAGDVMKDSEDPSSGSFFESESVENAAQNVMRTGETVTAKGSRTSVKTANRLLSYGKDQISVTAAVANKLDTRELQEQYRALCKAIEGITIACYRAQPIPKAK